MNKPYIGMIANNGKAGHKWVKITLYLILLYFILMVHFICSSKKRT